MKSWKHDRKDGLVFPNPKQKEEAYIFNKTPARHLARLCDGCEITTVTVRGLRHSYATRHFEVGTPIKTVQKLLGHEKFETTMNIYTHVMPDIKRRQICKPTKGICRYKNKGRHNTSLLAYSLLLFNRF